MKPEIGTVPYSFRIALRVPYSAQYHRQHCTRHAFKQFGALYLHNPYGKYPIRPGYDYNRLKSKSGLLAERITVIGGEISVKRSNFVNVWFQIK